MAGLEQANPNPRTESKPPANPRAFFNDFLKRFYGTTGPLWCSTFGFEVLLASSIGGFGFGQSNYLFWVTTEPLTT